MAESETLPSTVIDIVETVLSIFETAQNLPQFRKSLAAYKDTCRKMPAQISSGRLKVAVIGVIKSGKSAFVNSLIGKEIVKRGTGVTTSITTRIRKGKKNKAVIHLKSWDEINAILKKALTLFPCDEDEKKRVKGFDIRREDDRIFLKTAFKALMEYGKKNQDRHEIHHIRHAINGFHACKDMVQSDETCIRFDSSSFDEHKKFTADADNAFYVKDACLDVYGKTLSPQVEIADCQGSDSTDPTQLASVLSCLESANLIFYCISSGTGIRQSDMTFLKKIKDMGLLKNTIFINNSDLSEHENLEDLKQIERNIISDLTLLKIEPACFSISCLYNLFVTRKSKLTEKEKNRLRLWQKDKRMTDYCEKETKRLKDVFHKNIEKNYHTLLVSNHLNRLSIILAAVENQCDIYLDLLSADKTKKEKAVQMMDKVYENASRLEAVVEKSIDPAAKDLNDSINRKLDHIFQRDEYHILKDILWFAAAISPEKDKYRSILSDAGFRQILYLLFQDFRKTLDLFVIEKITPRLKKCVGETETKIELYFQSLFDACQIDLTHPQIELQYSANQTTHASYKRDDQNMDAAVIDLQKIKRILGLKMPDIIFEAHYTNKVKARAMVDFGLHAFSQIIALRLKRKPQVSVSELLQRAIETIKKEHKKVLTAQFFQYHAYLKNDYFPPLIASATRAFKEKIEEHFNQYKSIKVESETLIDIRSSEKIQQKNRILTMKQKIQEIANHDLLLKINTA